MSGMWAFSARGRRKTCGQTTLRGVNRSTSPSLPPVWQRRFCGRVASAGQRRAGACDYPGEWLSGGAIRDDEPGRTPLGALVGVQTSFPGPILCPDLATDLARVRRVCAGRRLQLARGASCGGERCWEHARRGANGGGKRDTLHLRDQSNIALFRLSPRSLRHRHTHSGIRPIVARLPKSPAEMLYKAAPPSVGASSHPSCAGGAADTADRQQQWTPPDPHKYELMLAILATSCGQTGFRVGGYGRDKVGGIGGVAAATGCVAPPWARWLSARIARQDCYARRHLNF